MRNGCEAAAQRTVRASEGVSKDLVTHYSRPMDSDALAGDHAGRRAAIRRLAIYAACLGAIVLALALTGTLPSAAEVSDWGESLDGLAVALYVPLFVILNFAIAWAILAGAGGLLFGTAVATPLALL